MSLEPVNSNSSNPFQLSTATFLPLSLAIIFILEMSIQLITAFQKEYADKKVESYYGR
jgi:hypothetical protein